MAVCAMLIALAFVPACAPSSGPPRGFDSRQILMVRDPLLNVRAFSKDASQIYLARYLADPATVKGEPAYNRSLLTLATGMDRPIQEAVVYADFLDGGPGHGRALVLLHYASAADLPAMPGAAGSTGHHLILSFVDEATDERLDIPDVAGIPMLGATRSDPLAVKRFSVATGGTALIWMGLAENLMLVGDVDILGLDATGAFAHLDQFEHFLEPIVAHLPVDGSEPIGVVPFHLGEYVAVPSDAGALPDPGPVVLDQDVWYACPILPDGARGRCLLLFRRGLSSGTNSLFARFVDDPREIALPGSLPNLSLLLAGTSSPLWSPRRQVLMWLGMDVKNLPRLFSWQVGADRVGSCAVSQPTLERSAWTPNEDRFAILRSTSASTASENLSSWTLFTGTPGEACRAVATGSTSIKQLLFSPDGNMLARLETAADGTSTIHVSASDGTDDRVIATSVDFGDISFLDDHRLLVSRTNADGTGISWIDPTTASAPEHPIAERVTRLASSIWLNARWLLVAHSYSAQDDTFTLSAIDTQTGHRRDVSAAVTDFRVPWIKPPADATEVPVVYLVRGRVASAQDGIWSAHLPLADFPSEP